MEINSELAKEYLAVHAQYVAKYGDRIVVLYQIGDFYEIYGDENFLYKICHDALDIYFRKITTETALYTGGFPIKAVNKYVKLLLQKDYLVVICNQADSPTGKGKKIRVVSEMLSSATSSDDEVLTVDSQLLMSIYLEYENKVLSETSICYIDISTGQSTCIVDGIDNYTEIIRILKKLNPKQILINTEKCNLSKSELLNILGLQDKLTHIYINSVDPAFKKPDYAKIFFRAFYVQKLVPHLEYLGLDRYPSLTVSFIAMLSFITEFNRNIISKLDRPNFESYKGQLMLSENAIAQLHLLGDNANPGLFNIINKTCTPGGKRLLMNMLLNPITNTGELNQRYDSVEKMLPSFHIYRNYLSKIKDLERLHRKITLGTLQPNEFYYLNESYLGILDIVKINDTEKICTKEIPEVAQTTFYNFINDYLRILNVDNLKDLVFKNDITASMFKPGIFKDLDRYWEQHNGARSEMKEISVELGKVIGSEPFKIDFSVAFGYYLIAPQSKKKLLKDLNLEFKDTQGSVKIFNSRIKELSNIIINTNESIKKYSQRYFMDYLDKISTN